MFEQLSDNISELFRRLNNIVQIGTVSEVNKNKSLVKVKLGDAVTDWCPLMQTNTGKVTVWIAPQINEQVIYLCPNGSDAIRGIVIRGIFNNQSEEPAGANPNSDIIEFKSGLKIKHQDGNLDIEGGKNLNIKAGENLKITIQGDCELKAKSVVVDANKIDLGKGGAGIVTGTCLCAFTGAPHIDFSKKVTAIK